MTTAEGLKVESHSGWLQGLGNMLRKENYSWWRTRRWWLHAIVWTLVINGFIAMLLWLIPAAEPEDVLPLEEALQIFVAIFGAFATIGVIVIAQGAVVREKQTGTAEWVMSNPVTPGAFVLSKLLANALAVAVIIVLLQSLLFYTQISLREGEFYPIGQYVLGISLISLALAFFLTLTVMLGTMFSSRVPVVGIGLAVFIGQDIVAGLLANTIAWLPDIMPQRLLEFAQLAVAGESLTSYLPIVVASLLSLLFVIVAIWRFAREEF